MLVGFMGTGKSSVAKELARLTGLRVIELDEEVEREAGRSISELFASEGEARFRDREASALVSASTEGGVIISTGGGAVLRQENVRVMKATGQVVCLTASTEVILKRVAGHGHRPLLNKPDPKAEIARLMAEREPFYRAAADITIETGGKEPSDIAREIREALGWKP